MNKNRYNQGVIDSINQLKKMASICEETNLKNPDSIIKKTIIATIEIAIERLDLLTK